MRTSKPVRSCRPIFICKFTRPNLFNPHFLCVNMLYIIQYVSTVLVVFILVYMFLDPMLYCMWHVSCSFYVRTLTSLSNCTTSFSTGTNKISCTELNWRILALYTSLKLCKYVNVRVCVCVCACICLSVYRFESVSVGYACVKRNIPSVQSRSLISQQIRGAPTLLVV